VAGLDAILKAADLIADVRKAFSKIENLEQGQRQLAGAVEALDRRLREQEASLRESRAEIRLDAVKETQAIVNGVQGQIYHELRSLAVSVDRLGRAASAEPRLVSNAAGAGDGKASDGGATPG
jgi:hypothetical protein